MYNKSGYSYIVGSVYVMNGNKLNKDYLEHVLANIESSVCVVNLERKIIYVNNLAKHRLYQGREFLNPSMYDIFPDLTIGNSVIERVFATGKPEMNTVCMWTDINKKQRISLISVFPIIDNNEIVAVCEAAEPMDELSSESKEFFYRKFPHINEILKDEFKVRESHYCLSDIIGDGPATQELKRKIILAANSQANLLIYGETGTGKEMIAQSVYSMYKANDTPFIAQNCAAIPESLLESSLFGTVKGSFTGAETRPGLFELANKGVLFLDEINSMPLNLQAKILRPLQEHVVRRVGGLKEIPVNFRLITATNTKPDRLVGEGMIRNDLFYRICVVYLEVPPLRARKDEIPILVKHFVEEFNDMYGKSIVGFDRKSINFFMEYDWPGNVRELKNVVERSICMSSKKIIAFDRKEMFPFSGDVISQNFYPCAGGHDILLPKFSFSLKRAVTNFEISLLKETITKYKGNLSKAAQELEIPQQTLQNKLSKFHLREFVQETKNKMYYK